MITYLYSVVHKLRTTENKNKSRTNCINPSIYKWLASKDLIRIFCFVSNNQKCRICIGDMTIYA